MTTTTYHRQSADTESQAAEERARALSVVDRICGPLDEATHRAGRLLEAHAAALAWVRETTGHYPSPRPVADAIRQAAASLRDGSDERDPGEVLSAVAAEALAAYLAAPS